MDIQAEVQVRIYGKVEKTSVGRVIIASVTPSEVPFTAINQVINKKSLASLIDICFRLCGGKATAILADSLMELGFKYATLAGISICVDDMPIPPEKVDLINKAQSQVQETRRQCEEGLITEGESHNKIVDLWSRTNDAVTKVMMSGLEKETLEVDGKPVETASFNSIFVHV